MRCHILQPHLGLSCLLRPVCLNTYNKYGSLIKTFIAEDNLLHFLSFFFFSKHKMLIFVLKYLLSERNKFFPFKVDPLGSKFFPVSEVWQNSIDRVTSLESV